MIVSHAHRFVFMKTLKTAGTSAEIALSRVCGPDDVVTPISRVDEITRHEVGGVAPQNHGAPPLTFRVSGHTSAKRAREAIGRDTWDSYTKLVIERNPWDAVVSLYYWIDRHHHVLTFGEFMAGPQPARLANRNYRIWHLRRQQAVDQVLRFETLDHDLAEVWQRLSLPGGPTMPRAKGGVRPTEISYRDHYDSSSQARVAELFGPMIEELGYEF